jgi:hypothetical protein
LLLFSQSAVAALLHDLRGLPLAREGLNWLLLLLPSC